MAVVSNSRELLSPIFCLNRRELLQGPPRVVATTTRLPHATPLTVASNRTDGSKTCLGKDAPVLSDITYPVLGPVVTVFQ
jgi:hypothetical protein